MSIDLRRGSSSISDSIILYLHLGFECPTIHLHPLLILLQRSSYILTSYICKKLPTSRVVNPISSDSMATLTADRRNKTSDIPQSSLAFSVCTRGAYELRFNIAPLDHNVSIDRCHPSFLQMRLVSKQH